MSNTFSTFVDYSMEFTHFVKNVFGLFILPYYFVDNQTIALYIYIYKPRGRSPTIRQLKNRPEEHRRDESRDGFSFRAVCSCG